MMCLMLWCHIICHVTNTMSVFRAGMNTRQCLHYFQSMSSCQLHFVFEEWFLKMTGFIPIVNCSAAAARSLRPSQLSSVQMHFSFHPRQHWAMLQRLWRDARNFLSGVNRAQTFLGALFRNREEGSSSWHTSVSSQAIPFLFIPLCLLCQVPPPQSSTPVTIVKTYFISHKLLVPLLCSF